MFKPRIKYAGLLNQWVCSGKDITRFGGNPAQAYIKWRLESDKQRYLETKVCGFDRLKNKTDLHRYTNDWHCTNS